MNKKINFPYSKFKKDINYTLSLSGSVSFVVLVLYVISALFLYLTSGSEFSNIWSMLLLLVFIMIIVGLLSPFLYSYFANNAVLDGPDREKVGIKSLFKTSKFGFKPPFKGLLNTWLTLIISFIIFIFTTSIAEGLILGICYGVDPTYKEFFDSLKGVASYDKILEAINNNSSLFTVPVIVSNLIALVASLFFFLRNLLINILKFALAGNFLNVPRKVFNYVFRQTIKKHKKEFIKGFYRYAWIILTVFFVALIGSYLGLYFAFSKLENLNAYSFMLIISLTSIVIALILSLIFYPILFNHYLEISEEYRNYAVNGFVEFVEAQVSFQREKINLDKEAEDELDLIEKRTKEFKEQYEKEVKEEKKNEDDSSNGDSDEKDK